MLTHLTAVAYASSRMLRADRLSRGRAGRTQAQCGLSLTCRISRADGPHELSSPRLRDMNQRSIEHGPSPGIKWHGIFAAALILVI